MISAVDGEGVECCGDENEFVNPSTLPLEERMICYQIKVPPGDEIRKDVEGNCINFVRSVSSPDIGIDFFNIIN